MRASVLVVVLVACAVAAVVATETEAQSQSQAEMEAADALANAKAVAEMEAMSAAELDVAIEASRRALLAAQAKAGACTPKLNLKCPRTGLAPYSNNYQKKGTYNGCGAAGSWLDDSILGGKFTPCCNNHDICYGKSGFAKNGCDTAFYNCMYKLCTGLSTLFCRTQAAAYYQAVSSFGCGAYESARIENGCPPAPTLRSAGAAGAALQPASGAGAVASVKRRAAVSSAYEAAMTAMKSDVPASAVAAAAKAPVLRSAPGDAPVEADKICN